MCSAGKDIQEKVCCLNFSFWYRRQNIQAVFSIYRQCTNICQAIMSENKSAKAYLERRKAVVGRLLIGVNPKLSLKAVLDCLHTYSGVRVLVIRLEVCSGFNWFISCITFDFLPIVAPNSAPSLSIILAINEALASLSSPLYGQIYC